MQSNKIERSFIPRLWLGMHKTAFEGRVHLVFRRPPVRWAAAYAIRRGWGVTLSPLLDLKVQKLAYLSYVIPVHQKGLLDHHLETLLQYKMSLKSLDIQAKSLTLYTGLIEQFEGLETLGANCKLNRGVDLTKLMNLTTLVCYDPTLFLLGSLSKARQIKNLGCVGYHPDLRFLLPDSLVNLQLIRGLPSQGLHLERLTALRRLSIESVSRINFSDIFGVDLVEELELSNFTELQNLGENLDRWPSLRAIRLEGSAEPWQHGPAVRQTVPAGIRVYRNGFEL
jgi:hypothetical protein